MNAPERTSAESTALVVHVPKIETHDLDPDSVAGLVTNSGSPPAVKIDGTPLEIPAGKRRVTVPLSPGEHRVEVMVKQRYETVAVTLAAGETAEVRIGYRRNRIGGDDKLFIGGKTHVDQAMNSSSVLGNSIGCGALLLVPAVIGFTAGAAVLSRSRDLDAGTAAALGVGAAIAFALVGAVTAGLITRFRTRPDPASTAPPPIRPHDAAYLLPAATGPERRPGVLLRIRARPRTLNMIGFPGRMLDPARADRYEFYFNEPGDWVSPPRVHFDGVDLGSAWGTWWIPAQPGTHRLRVEFTDIGGHRLEGFEAETDVAVEDGVRQVEARFNFLDMVNQRDLRTAQHSRWQRIMRRTKNYEAMSEQAAGEPAIEFETATPDR